MITNRSNHIPTFTSSDRTNSASRFVRIRLIHRNCGTITLHVTMIQYAHAYGPSARFRNANRS